LWFAIEIVLSVAKLGFATKIEMSVVN